MQRGVCLKACKDHAKGTVDITHWPVAQDAGVELITKRDGAGDDARAPDGLATGAVYLDDEGAEHSVRAGVVDPRRQRHRHAAAAAASPAAPDGLANSCGLVGKRLMMHPFGTVVGLFEDELESWQGPWGQWLHSLEFYETDESRGFVRGAKWGLQPTGAPLSMTTSYPWGAENPIWGDGFHDDFARRFGRSAMWGIIAEDLPEEANRVVLGEGTDRHGIRGREDRLPDVGELDPADALPRGARGRVAAGGRRVRDGDRAADPRDGLAPARHGGDGRPTRRPRWSTATGAPTTCPNLFVFDG